VAEQVRTTDDAFLGLEVDEKERGAAQGASARAERQLHRHLDCPRANAAHGELQRVHFFPAAYSARMSHTARLAGVGTPAAAPSCATPPLNHSSSSRLPRCRSCAMDAVISAGSPSARARQASA